MSTPIQLILDSLFNTTDNWQIQLLKKWRTIVGNLKTQVQLLKIHGDTLVIGVMDSCWLQELHLLTPLLLKTINENLDQPRIKHLRFKIIGLPTTKKAGTRTEEKKVQTVVRIASNEKEALATITDPELRLFLEQYLKRCYQERV